MKKYEAYKDSGIEWIGEIPEGWEISRIKYLLEQSKDGIKIGPFGSTLTGKVDNEGEYKVYGQWNIVGKDFNAGKNFVSAETFDALEPYHISSGDLFISMMGTVGKCAIIPEGVAPGIMDSHVVKARLDKTKMLSKFFEYVYDKDNSNVIYSQIQKYRKGSIMDGLNSTLIKEFFVPCPSFVEQQAIVSYLDYKVDQINASVSAINSQIDDLKAYRQSIISETVTKGLKSDVKMKDSGVEWIGEIPEEWEFRKIKTLLTRDSDNIKVGPFGSSLSGNDIEAEGNYWVYNQRTILDNNFTTNNSFVSDDKYQELKSFSVYPGDILITTRGTIGKVAIVPEGAKEGILHPCVIRFKVDESMVNKQYLKYIFNDCNIMSEQVKYGSNATTIEVIYSYTLKDLKMPVPSLSEQQAIATYLDIKTSKIDSAIKSLEAQRDDLNAFKQSIISEAVTGKIDVRDWKPSIE